jgi:hypothetical protein
MDSDDVSAAHSALIVDAGPLLRPVADRAWDFERARLAQRRYIAIDLETLASPASRSSMEETIKWWFGPMVTSSYPDRFRLLVKAMIGLAGQTAPWRSPESRARPISMQAQEDQSYRRCVRVIAMVHELHKAGYQRIRLLPMLAPSGCYWRGIITFADNVAEDGYHILDEDLDDRSHIVARYTSGQENNYFGWTDAKSLNARQLAELFLQRFPLIGRQGEGSDWAYAGWLTDVLGEAEAGPGRGGLVHLIQDWDAEPAYKERWRPPPPERRLGYP